MGWRNEPNAPRSRARSSRSGWHPRNDRRGHRLSGSRSSGRPRRRGGSSDQGNRRNRRRTRTNNRRSTNALTLDPPLVAPPKRVPASIWVGFPLRQRLPLANNALRRTRPKLPEQTLRSPTTRVTRRPDLRTSRTGKSSGAGPAGKPGLPARQLGHAEVPCPPIAANNSSPSPETTATSSATTAAPPRDAVARERPKSEPKLGFSVVRYRSTSAIRSRKPGTTSSPSSVSSSPSTSSGRPGR